MPVIKVQNLSKSYTISHQRQERYTALREVMANSAKHMGHRAHSLDGLPTVQPERAGEALRAVMNDQAYLTSAQSLAKELSQRHTNGLLGNIVSTCEQLAAH